MAGSQRCGLCNVGVSDWDEHKASKTHLDNMRNDELVLRKVAESQKHVRKAVDSMMEKIATPECDKIRVVHEKSQLIGEFLDWLSSQNIILAKDSALMEKCGECGEEFPVGYLPHRESIEQLLARFFNIDLDEAEDERRKILEDLRSGK
jgi:hypothetical protein